MGGGARKKSTKKRKGGGQKGEKNRKGGINCAGGRTSASANTVQRPGKNLGEGGKAKTSLVHSSGGGKDAIPGTKSSGIRENRGCDV